MKCYLLHGDVRLRLTRSVPEVARDMFRADPELTELQFAKSHSAEPHVTYVREGTDVVWYARVQSRAHVKHAHKRTVRQAPDVGEWQRVGLLTEPTEPDDHSTEVFRGPTSLEPWEGDEPTEWKWQRIKAMRELRLSGIPLDLLDEPTEVEQNENDLANNEHTTPTHPTDDHDDPLGYWG